MSLKRLLNPNPLMNEKSVTYTISNSNQYDVTSLLDDIADGVFGVEISKDSTSECFNVFTPIYHKNSLSPTHPHKLISSIINIDTKDITIANFYLEKASMFPLEMTNHNSIWNAIKSFIPNELSAIYQLLLSHRQDRWRELLSDQYECYLNGIEQPSNNNLFRKIQLSINEKVDSFLKWEYSHSAIEEVDKKINEKGFRYNLRIVLIDGNKKQRELIMKKIKNELNKYSYLNNWLYVTSAVNNDTLGDIVNRKFNGIAKSDILCASELIPFMTYSSDNISNVKMNEVKAIQKPIVDISNSERVSNPFELLPYGDDLVEVNCNDIADNFMKSLKEVKSTNNRLKLKSAQSGATLVKMTFELQGKLRLSELTNKKLIQDMQNLMGVRGLSVEQSEHQGEVDVFIPLEVRKKLFLRNYIDTDEFREFSSNSELPVIIGVDTMGISIMRDLIKLRSLLIVGTMGSGKSVEINSLILTLLMNRSPEELSMYLIDVKKVEFSIFEKFKHVRRVVTEADDSISLLKDLITEMDRRYDVLKKAEVKNITQYNKKYPNNKLSYIVLICDEYAELAMRNEDVHELIQSLSQLGRASGIIPIISSQFSTVDIIPSKIKNNLASKIVFRLANSRSYLTVLNTKPDFELLGLGDGIFSEEGSLTEHLRFQGLLICDKDESRVINEVADYIDNNEVIEEESELDKLKRVILENNTCKVNELRGIMKVNINKLNDMMKDLVDDGFLLPPESRQSGYKVNPEYGK